MISIIVAVAKDGVIGNAGNIPWNLPDDLKHFAETTRGHTVIMGRKTYESIVKRLGHPLPNRKNVVITSQSDFDAPGCTVMDSIEEAMKSFSSDEEVFVIGGGEIYRQFLPMADKLYITEVSIECGGDAFFPSYGKDEWELISSEHHEANDRNPYQFSFLEFIRK